MIKDVRAITCVMTIMCAPLTRKTNHIQHDFQAIMAGGCPSDHEHCLGSGVKGKV